jgi:GDPmannose 4,6-dehydratase
MTPKVALIIGANGQDGSYCAELLLEKGYIVHGIIRRSSVFNTQRINHIFDKIHLHYGDLTDSMSLYNIIKRVCPDEIYNFGAQSHVKVSADVEAYTLQANTLGVLSLLQSVRDFCPKCKVYQAGTSEQFGNQTDGSVYLKEDSRMNPVSIYGISKLAAQNICNMYRDAYGMFVVSSVLFNHESRRRGDTFVTKKIANYVRGDMSEPLLLGNLDASRDWGHAKDYVYAIWLMMQQDTPSDYVIASGHTHSVREFVDMAFRYKNIDIEWIGKGADEYARCKATGKILVRVSLKYYRDIDIECLLGDSSLARKKLGWEPKITFEDLVKDMVLGV